MPTPRKIYCSGGCGDYRWADDFDDYGAWTCSGCADPKSDSDSNSDSDDLPVGWGNSSDHANTD